MIPVAEKYLQNFAPPRRKTAVEPARYSSQGDAERQSDGRASLFQQARYRFGRFSRGFGYSVDARERCGLVLVRGSLKIFSHIWSKKIGFQENSWIAVEAPFNGPFLCSASRRSPVGQATSKNLQFVPRSTRSRKSREMASTCNATFSFKLSNAM